MNNISTYVLAFISLTSCSVVTLPSDKNLFQLPTVNGVVAYERVVIKKGIKFDEFYRVARAWVRENKSQYLLEWEKPVFKATLLHSGIIPAERFQLNSADHYSNTHVDYFLTIDAKNDTCHIMASTFEVNGRSKKPLFIEQVADDKIICQTVNQEMNRMTESLSDYIRKNSEKPW